MNWPSIHVSSIQDEINSIHVCHYCSAIIIKCSSDSIIQCSHSNNSMNQETTTEVRKMTTVFLLFLGISTNGKTQ